MRINTYTYMPSMCSIRFFTSTMAYRNRGGAPPHFGTNKGTENATLVLLQSIRGAPGLHQRNDRTRYLLSQVEKWQTFYFLFVITLHPYVLLGKMGEN